MERANFFLICYAKSSTLSNELKKGSTPRANRAKRAQIGPKWRSRAPDGSAVAIFSSKSTDGCDKIKKTSKTHLPPFFRTMLIRFNSFKFPSFNFDPRYRNNDLLLQNLGPKRPCAFVTFVTKC